MKFQIQGYEKYQKDLSTRSFVEPNDEITQLRLENQLLKEQLSNHSLSHHASISASATQALPEQLKKTHTRFRSQ